MRIGLIQFCPKFRDPKRSYDRVMELCKEAKLEPSQIDILCLPEMALSGYMFDNKLPITDYLEDPQTGITFQLCSHLAIRYKCYVFAGYPERLDPSKEDAKPHQQGANSVHVVKPDGTLLMNYRKTNLFHVDESWAKPGTGFAVMDLPEPLNIRVALGVCMDLNVQAPAEWESLEDGPYELASFAKEEKADLLIVLNSWLATELTGSGDKGLKGKANSETDKPDARVFEYWYARLRPLWPAKKDGSQRLTKQMSVAICNRTGLEEGTLFAGTSALFRFSTPTVLGFMFNRLTRSEEIVAIWEV